MERGRLPLGLPREGVRVSLYPGVNGPSHNSGLCCSRYPWAIPWLLTHLILYHLHVGTSFGWVLMCSLALASTIVESGPKEGKSKKTWHCVLETLLAFAQAFRSLLPCQCRLHVTEAIFNHELVREMALPTAAWYIQNLRHLLAFLPSMASWKQSWNQWV